jgi:hypothetical protein
MDEKQKEEIREIVKIAIQEFMSNLYGGIGKQILNKLIWAIIGAGIVFFFGVPHK